MLEDILNTPETAASDHCRFLAGRCSFRLIGSGIRNRGTGTVRSVCRQTNQQSSQDQKDTKRRLGHGMTSTIVLLMGTQLIRVRMRTKVSPAWHPFQLFPILSFRAKSRNLLLDCSSPKLNLPFCPFPPSDTPDTNEPAGVDISETGNQQVLTDREKRSNHGLIQSGGH
jgi:hypothetical protein